MADISQVLINGTTYTLKDAAARSAIGSLNSFEYYVCTAEANTPIGASFMADDLEIRGQLVPSEQTKFKIYLVPASDAAGNIFDEYITVEPSDNTYAWERFGNTSVDISGYLTEEDAAQTYAPKVRPTFGGQISIGGESLTEAQLREIKGRKGFEYFICNSAAHTPAGFSFGGEAGTLEASELTENLIFMVPIGGSGANKYAEYITVKEEYVEAPLFELEDGEQFELEDGSPLELSCVEGGGSGEVQYRYVWEKIGGGGGGADGSVVVCSGPDNTPAGVKIKTNTGALAASENTENALYLVKNGKGVDKYDEYITVKEAYMPVVMETENGDALTGENDEVIEADGIEVESDEAVQYRYSWEKLGKTVTPDWNETDENSPSFIKNRPFGKFIKKGYNCIDNKEFTFEQHGYELNETGERILERYSDCSDGESHITLTRSEVESISRIQIAERTYDENSIFMHEDEFGLILSDNRYYDNNNYIDASFLMYFNVEDDDMRLLSDICIVDRNYEEEFPDTEFQNYRVTVQTRDSIYFKNIEAGGTRQGTGTNSTIQGTQTQAIGANSFAAGLGTIAPYQNMLAFGSYNNPDVSSYYLGGDILETVGNGNSDYGRQNARILDEFGHEWLDDTLTVTRDPVNNLEVATKHYVDNAVPNIDLTPYAPKIEPVFQNSVTIDNTSITESQLTSLLEVLSNIQPAAGVNF